MPYKEPEMRRYYWRCKSRKRAHGKNWRQIYVDCDRMCQWRNEDGELCGSMDGLEFHENFGEDHNGDGRMQQRLLLCYYHHYLYHMEYGYGVNNCQPNISKLKEDVFFEIERAGSYKKWLEKYGLIESNGHGEL